MLVLCNLIVFAPTAMADPWLEEEEEEEEETTTCDLISQEELAADARWVRASDGVLELVADGPPGMEWEVRATVSIAGLTASWTQEVAPDLTGRLALRLSPPASAFLHEVAADYLTGLRVHLYGRDATHMVPLSSPPAFLAWPGGQAAGPEVWDRATVAERAPNGIVSASVRSAMAT